MIKSHCIRKCIFPHFIIYIFTTKRHSFMQKMKQSSLLDSFIKRQNKTQTKRQVIPSENYNNFSKSQSKQNMKNEHREKEQIEEQSQKKLERKNNNKLQKKSKMSLDSDDEDRINNIKIKSQSQSFDGQKNQKKMKKISEVQHIADRGLKNSDSELYQLQYQQFEDYNNKGRQMQQQNANGKSFKKVKSDKKSNKKQEQLKQNKEQIGQSLDDQLAQFTDVTPIWALPQNHKDKNGKKQGEQGYDPTTLYIAPQKFREFTDTMKQFWSVKADNYDKIVLFKLGKFYQLFYQDAYKAVKLLKLKWMGKKMHSGFPQKSLQKYAIQLTNAGQKVVIVQQMETPQQMQKRIAQEKKTQKKVAKTLDRQVTQIITKGTANFPGQDEGSFLPNYLISVRPGYSEKTKIFAYSLLDIATNSILYGYEQSFQDFKTLLYQTRPVQLVYDPQNITQQLYKVINDNNFSEMVKSKLADKASIWHCLSALNTLKYLEQQKLVNRERTFKKLEQEEHQRKMLVYESLSGMFAYLKDLKKFDYVMCAVRFQMVTKAMLSQSMVLDSQALQHLQIFQTSLGHQGSLFQAIDYTNTKFSKRMLRRWVCSPLNHCSSINQRLDAVENLMDCRLEVQQFKVKIRKLPDIQRMVNRLYHYSIKTFADKAVLFEDISTMRLKQFRSLQQHLKNAWDAIQIFRRDMSLIKSYRLKKLLTFKQFSDQQLSQYNDSEMIYQQEQQNASSKIQGLLPNINLHLKEFKSYIVWNEKDLPEPQKGLATAFDQLKCKEQQIHKEAKIYLHQVQVQMNQPNICFTHIKQRFQLQIPEKSQKRRPKNWEFTSRRNGFSRYVNPETRAIVKKLEKVQNELKQSTSNFVGFFFEEFKKKKKIWDGFVTVIAELDCLIGLATCSQSFVGCRPVFSAQTNFQIKKARHPCLVKRLSNFIPNDINLTQDKVMLLTGPNMGGKSTVLRTTCLLSIMAQIGCFVPAQSYHCQLIDRIFTRIGASDQMLQGKSTFFIEMEETQTILKQASKNSLAIMDQLGRGTSTFDGMAIAHSVLKQISQQIGCFCLFATHYHTIVQQFMSKQHLMKNKLLQQSSPNESTVAYMMMDSMITNDDKIFFTYQLKPGKVQKSFGINVARMVGIPEQALRVAEIKAEDMKNQIEQKKQEAFLDILDKVFHNENNRKLNRI